MGALIRAHDWAASPLGEPRTWPQGLKTSVRLLLSTGHPMFLWWGPELIQFYNDAYRRSIGPERHPSAIGQRGRECWAEIWDIIGPQIEQVMAGRGYTWHENQLVPITRHGKREDVYWTYSYGPIDDPSAPHGVGGVLVVCTETTEQVLAEQRLRDEDRRKDEFLAMLGHELRNPLVGDPECERAARAQRRVGRVDAQGRGAARPASDAARHARRRSARPLSHHAGPHRAQTRARGARQRDCARARVRGAARAREAARGGQHGQRGAALRERRSIANRAGGLERPDECREVHGSGRPNRSDAHRARRER